jgi:putative SbcD/Mre11-related phosphoesterase
VGSGSRERRLIEVGPGISLVEGLPVLVVEEANTIIVADVHLGYEDAMARAGVFLPRIQLRSALRVLSEALDAVPWRARVVVDGDLKHVFEKLTRQEKAEIARLARWLSTDSRVREAIVVRGNHDTFIAPVLENLGIELVEDCLEVAEGLAAAHGHKMPGCDFEVVVIGHEHPSIQVDVGGARVKLPVMLDVPLEDGGRAIVLPALGAYQTGRSITLDRSEYMSPIIRDKGVIDYADVWVVDREAGTMRLGELRYVLPL